MKKRNMLILILLLGSLSLSALAQKTDIKVDGQRIKNTIAYMASDEAMGRKPITPEFFEVQEWAVQQYKAWGLEPAGDNGSFYQSVPIERGFAVTYGTPKLIINGREFFAHFGDFSIDTQSKTNKKIKGNIVFVG